MKQKPFTQDMFHLDIYRSANDGYVAREHSISRDMSRYYAFETVDSLCRFLRERDRAAREPKKWPGSPRGRSRRGSCA